MNCYHRQEYKAAWNGFTFMALLGIAVAGPLPAVENDPTPEVPAREKPIRFAEIDFSELTVLEAANIPPLAQDPEVPFRPLPRNLEVRAEDIVATDGTVSPLSHGIPTGPSSPAPDLTFQALVDDYTRIPPDTHGAIGPNHVMTVLNSQVRIQDRSGNILSTVSLAAFWATLGNPAPFDPKLLYDPFQSRWIFTACADNALATSSLLIGVTQNSNPTGTWYLQRIDVDGSNLVWADYPSIGFNKDWIAVSVILFNISGGFNRGDVFVFGKAQLYSGGAATFMRWQGSAGDGAVQVPAATYDNTLNVLYLLQTFIGNDPSGFGFLRLYAVTGPVNTPTLNPVGFIATAQTWSASAADQLPMDGFPDNLAPQRGIDLGGNSYKIQTNDDRMQNVVYRNGSLWGTHMIFLPTGTPGQQGTPTRTSAQWWEITPSTIPANVQVVQRGLIDDPTNNTHYAFPSIAVNQNDDALIGYSLFSPTRFASSAYSYRDAGDAANVVRAPFIFKAGEANYVRIGSGNRNRWGDYSHTVVDPVNDLDFWTIQEYADSSIRDAPGYGLDPWGTQWARVGPALPAGCPNLFDWSRVSVVAPYCPSECGMASYDMVFDPVRNSVVLFQGNGAFIQTENMTWDWDGDRWNVLNPVPNPGKRVIHRMVYDTQRSKAVLFGGVQIGTGTLYGDTWEYDSANNTWTQVSTGGTGDPPARFHPGFAYDAQRGEAVLFGGQHESGGMTQAYGDTWTWNGTSWTQKAPATNPSARMNPAMVYDPGRQRVVMYGGSPAFGPAYDETWEWNGTDWTQKFPSITPGTGGGAMAYDASRGVSVLYTTSTVDGNDLWQWDGASWLQLQESSPIAQQGARVAYDTGRREFVMYDGSSNPPNFYAETFVIQSTVRAFCLSGTATGAGWSWCVEGPGYEVCDLNVLGVAPGSNAGALAARFVASLDAAGCSSLDGTIVATSPQCFNVTVARSESFNLIVGGFGNAPTCSLGPGSNCTINPVIAEVSLSGADCNANFTDDAIDIATGVSEDSDTDGIPDECQCVSAVYGDLAPPGGDGIVELGDLLCVLDGYNIEELCPGGDIWPCGPGGVGPGGDGLIELGDVLALLDAYAGNPPCADPCP